MWGYLLLGELRSLSWRLRPQFLKVVLLVSVFDVFSVFEIRNQSNEVAKSKKDIWASAEGRPIKGLLSVVLKPTFFHHFTQSIIKKQLML